jgi:small subunit ribosomal protein S6
VPAQQQLQTQFLADIMTRTAKRLFTESALIRDIKYMGTRQLPYRMKVAGEYHTSGAYWLMYFYGGPQSVKRLRKQMEADTDIIRSTFTKQGDKLKDYVFNKQ